jgi:hypothetical protein
MSTLLEGSLPQGAENVTLFNFGQVILPKETNCTNMEMLTSSELVMTSTVQYQRAVRKCSRTMFPPHISIPSTTTDDCVVQVRSVGWAEAKREVNGVAGAKVVSACRYAVFTLCVVITSGCAAHRTDKRCKGCNDVIPISTFIVREIKVNR